jgi:YVTN family beta-propeller protein
VQNAIDADPARPSGRPRWRRPPGAAQGLGGGPDGRYAVISAGARTPFEPSGIVYLIDLRTRSVVGTVTGVGNDPYGLAVVVR